MVGHHGRQHDVGEGIKEEGKDCRILKGQGYQVAEDAKQPYKGIKGSRDEDDGHDELGAVDAPYRHAQLVQRIG